MVKLSTSKYVEILQEYEKNPGSINDSVCESPRPGEVRIVKHCNHESINQFEDDLMWNNAGHYKFKDVDLYRTTYYFGYKTSFQQKKCTYTSDFTKLVFYLGSTKENLSVGHYLGK